MGSKQRRQLETRAVALHIWNREAVTSAMNLIPCFLNSLKEAVRVSLYRDPRHLYCFWPHYSNIQPKYRQLVNDTIYEELGRSEIYLTERGKFKKVYDGIF